MVMSSYKWLLSGLVGLNLVLGGALYSRLAGERTAYAQAAGGGDLIAAAGHCGNYGVIYVLTRDGKLGAITFQTQGNGTVQAMGSTDVKAALARAAGNVPK